MPHRCHEGPAHLSPAPQGAGPPLAGRSGWSLRAGGNSAGLLSEPQRQSCPYAWGQEGELAWDPSLRKVNSGGWRGLRGCLRFSLTLCGGGPATLPLGCLEGWQPFWEARWLPDLSTRDAVLAWGWVRRLQCNSAPTPAPQTSLPHRRRTRQQMGPADCPENRAVKIRMLPGPVGAECHPHSGCACR